MTTQSDLGSVAHALKRIRIVQHRLGLPALQRLESPDLRGIQVFYPDPDGMWWFPLSGDLSLGQLIDVENRLEADECVAIVPKNAGGYLRHFAPIPTPGGDHSIYVRKSPLIKPLEIIGSHCTYILTGNRSRPRMMVGNTGSAGALADPTHRHVLFEIVSREEAHKQLWIAAGLNR